ncbi:MAG: threonine--tRNA ligase, partial [Candidatus Bathyarchaeota archaeon]|nr:threonine--tRNA ligase [Candidatus Bathyarchaeota archaeon]
MAGKVKVRFPDGSVNEFGKGVTCLDVARSISDGLANAAVAAMIDGEPVDLSKKIESDCDFRVLTFKDKEGVEVFRHSTAHLMAHAITRLYKKAVITIGPVVEEGFYYDIDHKPFTKEDLEKIEAEMKKIADEKLPIERKVLSKKAALDLFKKNKYKVELIEHLDDSETVSVYSQGDFTDLCRGPHLLHTGKIKAFKLTKVAGAYWRGDAKNAQLTRVYGVSFPDKKLLKEYLAMREEAERRDHAKLGKALDLFVTSDIVGKGLPLLTPKGTTIRRILQRWIEDEEIKRGYEFTRTPVMAKSDLYKLSGHLDHYRESMFVFETNGEEICLRPMTCPHQFMIYKSQTRSYRDLPMKYAEIADLFRNEQSGELHGLIRIRQFSLADAHIFCMPDQLEDEFEKVLELIKHIMDTLGFKDYWYMFSKWDPDDKDKYIDNPPAWEQSQRIMKRILDKLDLEYVEVDGEAAFYGPKCDIQMRNVWGKEETMFTVQIDFALPERFDLVYEGEDGQKHRPMVIHRSSIGCLERTMALLIEHYAGRFPLWLSPVQVKLLPVADRHHKYCEDLKKKLEKAGLRVELDAR